MRSIADACSRELGEALGSLIEEEGPVVLYELTLLESNEYGCVARGMESGRLLPAELASKEAAPDKPERLETPERPEKPEKPERPDCCCSCWTLRLRRLLWSCDGVGTMVDGTDAVGATPWRARRASPRGRQSQPAGGLRGQSASCSCCCFFPS